MFSMIASITGTLVLLTNESLHIDLNNGLVYEVHVPAFVVTRMSQRVGQKVTLKTLHYLESHNQGSSFLPRLAGFLSDEDRDFFELFTTVKGIGNRKALRALAIDTGQIAMAIADRDTSFLQSLPEIGKRTAETIIASLNGKVDHFASAGAFAQSTAKDATAIDANDAGKHAPSSAMSREALEVLMQLGENRAQAVNWINMALADEKDRPADVTALIERCFRIKAGS
jgi:Holliday junction DNA helicase RuvA